MADYEELNVVSSKARAIPYDDYFSAMGITPAQVEERVKFANDFDDFLMFIMALVMLQVQNDAIDLGYIRAQIENGYRSVVEPYIIDGMNVDDYIAGYADDFVNSTSDNLENPWYLSEDRAMFNAENEAVTMLGYKDFVNAKKRGMKHKRWVTFIDKRTRKTHSEINGKEIPIDDYFEVGDALALFPKDTFSPRSTLMDYPEELVNCRCSVKYTR